ncbi:MAG: hypothetical protein IKK39_14405, partial [Thermoguttaceae bacterium]|nr:hypothetical protein [Thermoguttaceae bacterium]
SRYILLFFCVCTVLTLGNYANGKFKNINFLEIWNCLAIITALCTCAFFFLLLSAWHTKTEIDQEEAQQKIEFREREKRKAEEAAQSAQKIIVTEDGSKILKAVFRLDIDRKKTSYYYFITRGNDQGYYNVWDKTECEDMLKPIFPVSSREAGAAAQKAVDLLLQGGLIERVEQPEWSNEKGEWYRLTPLGVAEASNAVEEENRSKICGPSLLDDSLASLSPSPGLSVSTEESVPLNPVTGPPVPPRPSIILEGVAKILRKLHANGVDDDGEYRFFVRGQDGTFEIGIINYFQNRKIETIAQDRPDQDFPLNAKLAVDQMLRENIIERTASPSWSHNDGVTWYKVTSYGLSQMRDSVKPPTSPSPTWATEDNLPAIPPNALPAAMQISPDSQDPPKEQDVETVPVPLGPAIPQETVPTPPAEPSV